MGPAPYSDRQIDAAIEELSSPDAFAEAERAVARAAPRLQQVLTEALAAGGWFGESHEAEVLKAATVPDQRERLAAVRTLLAEETRVGMLIGVAVGWALAERLEGEPSGGEAGAESEPAAKTETETEKEE